MQAQAVLEVISRRVIRRRLGLAHDDSYKLGLAVEGGGMRGILSASMLLAMGDLDMLSVFDCFTGTSSGSLNMAYALSGQMSTGLSVYLENLTDGTIFNPRRLRDAESAMLDTRQLHQMTTNEKALNEAGLLARHASNFYVSLSNVSRRQGRIINLAGTGKRFHEYLMAGATMPVISGKPWRIEGSDYYDGGLAYNDPSRVALELGCTHVLVLNTQYNGFVLKPHGRIAAYVVRRLDDDYNGAGSWYSDNLRRHCDEFATKPYGETTLGDMRLYRHALAQPSGIKRLTTDKAKLLAGSLAAYQSIMDIFYPQGHAIMVPALL